MNIFKVDAGVSDEVRAMGRIDQSQSKVSIGGSTFSGAIDRLAYR